MSLSSRPFLQSPSARRLTAALLACAVLAPAARAGLRDVRLSGEAPLRAWASRSAPALQVLREGAFVTLEAESRAPWFRVRTTGGSSGWIAGSLAERVLEADEGLSARPATLDGSARLLTQAELRDRPAVGRPISEELGAGTLVRVLEQWGTWVLLADAQGRSGWADLQSFLAEEAAPPAPRRAAAAATGPESSAAGDGRSARRQREARRDERAEEPVIASGPGGAELRERLLEERRERERLERAAERREREAAAAAREAARAEASSSRARRTVEEAQRAAADRDAEARAEAERRARDREAVREERRLEREARQARREAEAAARQRPQPAPSLEAEPEAETSPAERAAAREAERERRRLEREAERVRREEERVNREAERESARAAREAERGARELERPAPPEVQVQEMPEGPVAPVAIPPGMGVTLGDKSPAEKKPDPLRSPLVQEATGAGRGRALPVLDLSPEARRPPDEAAGALLEGFRPYDEAAQLERSVADVHSSPSEALDLSGAQRPAAGAPASYVNERGELVDTRIVSEIVLRVGTEILTRSELDRRVDELRERELTRTGEELSLDDARGRVLTDLVNDLILVHHGRALGVRFDAVYDSAKEEFKRSGGISDDLELLRLLDEMGMTFKDFRREMIRRTVPGIVLRNQVLGDVSASEEEVENYYRRHQSEWVQENCVMLRELVLQPEARETTRDFTLRLEEILARLESGEDFCDLARRHSRSPSAADCGRLEDCFVHDQLDEKVARVVFKMRPGDLEPIRTDWGYHLLRLEENRPRRVRNLDEVRDAIVRAIRTEKVQALIPRFLDELRRSVQVEVAPAFRRYHPGSQGGLGQ